MLPGPLESPPVVDDPPGPDEGPDDVLVPCCDESLGSACADVTVNANATTAQAKRPAPDLFMTSPMSPEIRPRLVRLPTSACAAKRFGAFVDGAARHHGVGIERHFEAPLAGVDHDVEL